MRYLLIRGADAQWRELSSPDVTAIPPAASLIAETDWVVLCKEAGGEMTLLKILGVVNVIDEDGLDNLDWPDASEIGDKTAPGDAR